MALHELGTQGLVLPGQALARKLRTLRFSRATLALGPALYILEGDFEAGPSVALWLAPGAVIEVRGSLTIRGPVFAPPQRIFATRIAQDGTATSGVVIDATKGTQLPEVLPEWWGAGAPDDRGEGLQAMALSLARKCRVSVRFEAQSYLARPMHLRPGHRFFSARGTTLIAAGPELPLLHIDPMLAVDIGSDDSPVDPSLGMLDAQTFIESVSFEGLGPQAAVEASGSTQERALVVVSPLPGKKVPLELTDCAFSKVKGTGLVIPPGCALQASRLTASQCTVAGIRTASVPESAGETTFFQWTNATRSPRTLFGASVRIGDGAGHRVIVQWRDVRVEGEVRVEGDEASRVTLTRCAISESLRIEAPGAQIIAVECQIRSGSFHDKPVVLGSTLKTPGVALLSQCTLEVDPGRSPAAQAGRAALTFDWRQPNSGGAPLVLMARVSSTSTPRLPLFDIPSVWLRSARGVKDEPVVMFDHVVLKGTRLGLLLEGVQHVLVGGASRFPMRSARVLDIGAQLVVSTPRLKSFFGGLDNATLFPGMCLTFQGYPMGLAEVFDAPMVDVEAIFCQLGGRLLTAPSLVALPTGALLGDQIVGDNEEPIFVFARQGNGPLRWLGVERES